MSATVGLEPLRLGAPRVVTVEQAAGGAGQVSVRLTGPDNVNEVRVVAQEADASIADPELRWRDVATTVLARTGTRAAAVHEGLVTLPTGGADRRLVIEDAEPVTVESGGALAASTLVAYREVVEIPESW